jgi:outer membrane receptor protein involved in Fe transport
MGQVVGVPVIVGWLGAPGVAWAQGADVEVPVLILETGLTDADEGDSDLDLANVVQSAAKGVTTVQEAPAIVTVITQEDIDERGYDNLEDIMGSMPGWLRHDALFNQFPFILTRGALQSMLYLNNGISLFDPWANAPQVGRMVPVESIKRIEAITGPGGVLWGANSFLGVVNVITKDAEDVDGVEANAGFGDGMGDRSLFKGYVMAGMPRLFSDDVSLFFHAGFQSYIGMGMKLPQHMFAAPLPQPNSLFISGPYTVSSQPRSLILNFDGKLDVGAISFYFSLPVIERHLPASFPGTITVEEHPEDSLTDPDTGELLCPPIDPYLPNGDRNPEAATIADDCVDRGRIARDHRIDWYDRYVLGEYRTRFADNKAGATFKVYGVQFVRNFHQLMVFYPSDLLEGGLSFRFDATNYRAGTSYDGDIELPGNMRLLYGAEAFYEIAPDRVETARQGAGFEAKLIGPYDLTRVALACPRRPDPLNFGQVLFVDDCPVTFLFAADRTVLGAYANPQWRPTKKLILDGGVRVQMAPEAFGNAHYDPKLTFSGAVVYNLAKSYHVKLNYAEGFRPPVFQNTHSNGESIQIDGQRDLPIETAKSIQGELNGRIFKGKREIREISFRTDYSYSALDNFIQVAEGGRYQNTGAWGIHSAEFLGKVFLQGGHRVELAYTWLRVWTAANGYRRMLPEHWFTLGGVYNLVPGELQATTTIQVLGAVEDANRLIEARPLVEYNEQISTEPHEMVMDRVPPSAELQVGLTYTGIDRLRLRAFAYNAFNTHHYNPDGFGVYEPRLEVKPNPYPDFRFVLSASYRY